MGSPVPSHSSANLQGPPLRRVSRSSHPRCGLLPDLEILRPEKQAPGWNLLWVGSTALPAMSQLPGWVSLPGL